ncbi:ABC-type antimicrobial peptide transport system permease subunit [Arcanobacterium pluranimalium]|uniref:ABC transporter permease n=1 Tax=Arcanobacterium pluranimalium TaxID=108028 RepID=UPI00195AFDD8|nr:FtsX-like permease family protein [Arcanobacterium pluranimalium]MBM7825768.1 ABC-type antimicrobial peptide transport system permease subunit [Arcanobacterium pluranimalium]
MSEALEHSVTKTAGQVAFSVTDPEYSAEKLANDVKALPEVESVYKSINLPAIVMFESHAIDANINNTPPDRWTSIEVTSGAYPANNKQTLISETTAQALDIQIGEEITIYSESSFALSPHKLTVSGIFSRSPFSNAALHNELLVNSPDEATGIAISKQKMSNSDSVLVTAKPHASRSLLREKIENITHGTITSAEELRDSIADEQARSIGYFQSILGWLLALPMLISGFVIAASTRSLVKNRSRAIAQLRVLGATRWYIFGLNISEILIIALLSTAIGHAIGRALVQVLIETMKSGSGGAFIPQNFSVEPSDYLLATLGSMGVAFLASIPSIMTYSFVPASHIYAQDKPRKNNFLLTVIFSLIILGLGTVALFFSIVVPEDLLFIVQTGNNYQSLRLMAMIALLLFAAFAAFFLLRFVVSTLIRKVRLSRSVNSFRLAATQHYADTLSRIGTLFIICTAACILGLTTMSSIKTTAHQESDAKLLPFDAAAKVVDTASLGTDAEGISQHTMANLSQDPLIDRILPVRTVTGTLRYADASPLENFYVYSMDPDAAREYFTSDTKFLRSLKPGTIIIPRDLLGIPREESPKSVTLSVQNSSAEPLTLQARYENVPWSIITSTDLKHFFSSRQTTETWIRFSTDGLADKAASYQATIAAIQSNAIVCPDVVLATDPPGDQSKNAPASFITLGLLTLTLILCVLAVCNSLYLSQQAQLSETRVLSGLGVSQHINSTSLVVSAIGRTTLSVFVGGLAGVTSGTYLATVYVGTLTWRQFFSIPWSSVLVLTLISALLAGIWTRIQTMIPSLSGHYG